MKNQTLPLQHSPKLQQSSQLSTQSTFDLQSAKYLSFQIDYQAQQKRIQNLRPKTHKQKKKERKKQKKEQKAMLGTKSMLELEKIVSSIYLNGAKYEQFENKLEQISVYLESENVFVNILNDVIIRFVENNITVLEADLAKYQTISNDKEKLVSLKSLIENPDLFKRLTDFVFEKYTEIQRAGINVLKVLNNLRSNNKEEQKFNHTYECLNLNVLRHLVEDHTALRLFLNCALQISKISIKKYIKLEDETYRRFHFIIKSIIPAIDESESSDEYENQSDSQAQQKLKKSQKRRNRKKKKNQQSKQPQTIEIQPQISHETHVFKLIETLNGQDQRKIIQLNQGFMVNLRNQVQQKKQDT